MRNFPNFRPHPLYYPPGYFQGSISGCFYHHIQGYDFSHLNRGESRSLFYCRLKPFTRSLLVSVLYPGSGSSYRSLTSCYPLPLSGRFQGSFPLSFREPFTRPFLNQVGVLVQPGLGLAFSILTPVLIMFSANT